MTHDVDFKDDRPVAFIPFMRHAQEVGAVIAANVDVPDAKYDSPEKKEARRVIALSLAENIDDVDPDKTAPLYSTLPDRVLMNAQKVSQELRSTVRQGRNMSLLGLFGASADTTISLFTGFGTASGMAYGLSALALGVGAVKIIIADKQIGKLSADVSREVQSRKLEL